MTHLNKNPVQIIIVDIKGLSSIFAQQILPCLSVNTVLYEIGRGLIET